MAVYAHASLSERNVLSHWYCQKNPSSQFSCFGRLLTGGSTVHAFLRARIRNLTLSGSALSGKNGERKFAILAESRRRWEKDPFSPCDLRKPVVVLTWKIRGTLLFLSTLELLNIQTRQNWELGAPVIYFFSEPHRPWKKLNLSCFKSGQKIRSDLFFFAPELLTLNIASTHLIGGAIRL